MLCVTHEMGFARQVADKVIFMDYGEIVEENPPSVFFSNPRNERTKLFFEADHHLIRSPVHEGVKIAVSHPCIFHAPVGYEGRWNWHCPALQEASWRSGYAEDCKSLAPRFDSGRGLHFLLFLNDHSVLPDPPAPALNSYRSQ